MSLVNGFLTISLPSHITESSDILFVAVHFVSFPGSQRVLKFQVPKVTFFLSLNPLGLCFVKSPFITSTLIKRWKALHARTQIHTHTTSFLLFSAS